MKRVAIGIAFLALCATIVVVGTRYQSPNGQVSAKHQSIPQQVQQKPYVLPQEFTLKPMAERGADGEIYVSGTTNFPDGMKMWVIVGPRRAQQDAFVRDGRFRSGPLYKGERVPVTGTQPVEMIAYFNGAWQSKDVLSVLGEGGKALKGPLFKETDPDVIDSSKILDAKFKLTLPSVPPVPLETVAINIVKHAILTVPGKGRSATNIEANIALFQTPGTGIRSAKGWSANADGKNAYTVAYDFIDGNAGEKQAIWSVNTATKQVRYVNEMAKIFSWTPNY